METVKVSTSQNIDIDYAVAGLGERITARLIDLGIFLGVYLLFIFLILITGISLRSLSFTLPFLYYTLIAMYMGAFIFYSLLCEIFMNGQSIGKRMMKIKVISIDGSQPTIGQYAIRWVFRVVDFWLTAQVGGLIAVAVSDKKQRIGDIVAGTTVIKTIPRTGLEHIAFHPTIEDYTIVHPNVHLLNDRDIELIHEVLKTFYQTANYRLIENLATRVADILGLPVPEMRKQLNFLNTVIKDYNHYTAAAL